MSALHVILASSGIALTMLIAFLILLFRRWAQEQRLHAEKDILAEVTKSYLQRVSGQRVEPTASHWRTDLKLAAVSHIHLLLRGGERERLMQLVELDGLLQVTISQSHSWRSARRVDAIRLLEQFGSEACIARLRQILTRDRNYSVRLEAAFALASNEVLPPPREMIRILDMFNRKTNRLDSALLRASAKHYVEQLVSILDDEIADEKRALIIDALGWSNDSMVAPKLKEASKSSNPELRSAALRAAAKLGHPTAADWIVRLLSDPVHYVRIQAVNSIISLGLIETTERLKPLLEDENIWVRIRVEHALEAFKSNVSTNTSMRLTA